MKRRIGGNGHAIAGVFVFLLLGVFAVFATVLVLFGAQAYRATTERTQAHEEGRTLYAYMLNSVRGDDAAGVMEIRNEKGIDLLAVSYDYGWEVLEKRIYCYDGYLREQLASTNYEFDPEMGERICEASDLHIALEGSLLTVEVTDANGDVQTVDTVLRTMR